MVIGKGGETIRGLEADFDVQIDIEEDGTILVYATEGTKGEAAVSAIHALTKSPEVGDTYTGKVVKTTEFGAFVELKKGTDGLLHVSNVGPGRVAHIEDVMTRGDVVDVLVQEVDKDRGRIGLKLDRQARGRRARDAGRADRAGEGRPAARAASAARRSRRPRPRPPARLSHRAGGEVALPPPRGRSAVAGTPRTRRSRQRRRASSGRRALHGSRPCASACTLRSAVPTEASHVADDACRSTPLGCRRPRSATLPSRHGAPPPHDASGRGADHHRARRRRPLGLDRPLDRRRLTRRVGRQGGRLALHRAPALQGHGALRRRPRSPSCSTRWAAS